MIKTFNRAPITVNTPSQNDVKNYFFNQYNWKGLIDDQNFLAIDQESFSNCNNVYVDTEGLLRSRPAMKIKTVTYNSNGQETVLSNVTNMWVFGTTTVYESAVNDEYYLTFVKDGETDNPQMPLVYTGGAQDVWYNDIKLVVADEKIFVFSEYALLYYDMKTNTCDDAEKFIHIPVTSVIVNGLVDNAVSVETPNVLTTSYITKYLYTNLSAVRFETLLGKRVTLELGGEHYNITFEKYTKYTLLSKYCSLTENYFADRLQLGIGGEGYPFVCTSEVSSALASFCTYKLNAATNVPTMQWTIYHTVDGVVFNALPTIDNVIGMPKLSRDGKYAFVFKDEGPYVYQVLDRTNNLKYAAWSNLLQEINPVWYASNPLHMNTIVTTGTMPLFNQSVVVNGDFITDDVFTFVYGTGSGYSYMPQLYRVAPIYNNILSVQCNGTDTIITNNNNAVTGILPMMPNVKTEQYNGHIYGAISYYDYNSATYRHIVCTASDANTNGYVIKRSIYTNTSDVFFNSGRTHRAVLFNDFIFESSSTPMFKYITYRYDTAQYHTEIWSISIASGQSATHTEPYVQSLNYTTYPNYLKYRYVFSTTGDKLVTNDTLYIKYNDTYGMSESTDLLFDTMPIAYYDGPTAQLQAMYLSTNNALYTNNIDTSTSVIVIDELTKGTINYMLPEYYAQIHNYYFSKGNALYISADTFGYNLSKSDTGTIVKKYNIDNFEWYFPEISKQTFNYPITNLHVISDTDVAIFLEHSISYVRYDNEVSAYRYYDSKMQVGCKKGCDVITSFDGKYVIFTSERGLVCMNYQEFIASSEQALSYLSDVIYSVYNEYITNEESVNEIKLFKYAYWVIAYKTDSKNLFVFDIRNNSWWPMSILYPIQKIVVKDDKLRILSNNSIFVLDTSDVDYADKADAAYKIPWHIQSQKLHLNNINYYKHIVNMTFTSVHDLEKLQESKYNVSDLDFKLQVFNYRKRIDGNIDTDDFTTVNYIVNSARTIVQRLNYSKVNEFQYLLSYNEDNAFELPLSLNSITVKYKVGTQVR